MRTDLEICICEKQQCKEDVKVSLNKPGNSNNSSSEKWCIAFKHWYQVTRAKMHRSKDWERNERNLGNEKTSYHTSAQR